VESAFTEVQHTQATEVPSLRNIERLTGGLMIIYMVAVAVQVAARTASTNSNASFAESLGTLATNHGMYLASMSAGLVSSILLIMLAAGLYSIFRARHHFLALATSFLFLAAALAWLTSAASGLALASLAQEFMSASGIQAEATASSARAVDLVRESTGRVGFTLAGLATLTLGLLIAWKDALPKWLGWLGVVVGILMLFIWNDSAAVLHRVGGTGYLVWLLITGGWLLVRGSQASQHDS
jgi:hypothetical protein